MSENTQEFCINPEVLKWARITIGISLENSAKKLKIEVQDLQKWEEGTEEAPITKIRKFASIYKRPTTVFLLNEVPLENVSTKFRKLLYSNIESFSSETLLALRKAIRTQTLAKDSFNLPQNQFVLFLKKQSALNDFEKISSNIISELGLEEKIITKNKTDYEQLNLWKSAIESKGIYVLELGFPEEEAQGFAIADEVAPIIVLNTHNRPKVRIFTLLHELSHFVYNTDAIDDISTIMNFNSTESVEVKCNYLAGNIMVPKAFLINKIQQLQLDPVSDIHTTLEVLTHVFNTSKQALLRRLLISDFIDLQLFKKFNADLKKSSIKFEFDKEEKRGGNYYINFIKNNSKSFIYDVLDAYQGNKIGHFEVLDYLNIKSTTLKKLEGRL